LFCPAVHGHSKDVLKAVREIKEGFLDAQVIAGNVAMKEGDLDLIKSGADAVKVGVRDFVNTNSEGIID
jgi:IMP dehydrogenase